MFLQNSFHGSYHRNTRCPYSENPVFRQRLYNILILLAIECCYLYGKQLYMNKKLNNAIEEKKKTERQLSKTAFHDTNQTNVSFDFTNIGMMISAPTREYKLSKQNVYMLLINREVVCGHEYIFLV